MTVFDHVVKIYIFIEVKPKFVEKDFIHITYVTLMLNSTVNLFITLKSYT